MTTGHQRVEDNWDAHWDRFGTAASGNPANSYRHRLITSRLAALDGDLRILDIGSGQGELALHLSECLPGAEVRGLEFSAAGVDRSRDAARTRGSNAVFAQRDLLAGSAVPDGESGWANAAVCSEVLEHVDDPVLFLRNARPYLAKDARLLITVPGGPRTAFDRYIGHRRHYTKSLLARVLSEAGFEVDAIYRAGFPFFNLYKMAVLLRGKAVISDVDETSAQGGSRLAEILLRGFERSFSWNRLDSRFGWQLVAEAIPAT